MKYVSLCMALLLSLMMFAACGGEESPGVDNNLIPSQVGNEQELQDVFERVAYLPVGTMGVTFKTTELAVQALDWCEKTDMTEEAVADALDAYYAQTADPMMYVEQMYSVSNRMTQMEDVDYRKRAMMDAGFDADDYAWTDKAFSLAAVFKNAVTEWAQAPQTNGVEPCFKATVTEVIGKSVTVTPLEGEDELRSADLIRVSLPDNAPILQVGDTLLIEYDGMIMESYPAQINADCVTVITE